MGYETRIYVVSMYGEGIGLHNNIQTAEEIASIELSKCGYEGRVAKLIEKSHKDANEADVKFALYARNPERQREAVEVLRDLAESVTSPKTESETWGEGTIEQRTERAEFLTQLSNEIEDGTITTDCYGDHLGVIPIDEFIAALEEDYKEQKYRRFKWAINLLKTIKSTYDGDREVNVITYGH